VGIGSSAYAIHQASAAEGPYTRIDDSLTASQVAPTLPASYGYTHTLSTPPGDPLYYKLEMIDVLGNSTFHGPIEPQAEGANTPPVAHAGWSYIDKEGSPLALNGAASADTDGDSLIYDWDFGDGTTLANGGASPSHTYSDNDAYQVCLTVTDPDVASATDCTTATIANLAPSVAPIQANPLSPTAGSPVTVTASFSDPGAGDSHSATWGWGDGDSSAATVDPVAGSVSGSHSYAASGVYTLTLSLSDDNQGTTTVTTTVTVMPAPSHTLTVNKVGDGTVTLNPPGGVYAAGTDVQLTATPDAGFTFAGWSGAVTGATNPITVIMDGNKTITVTFTESSEVKHAYLPMMRK
jgi:uncharacterized repeat protein (TIGR02543 family)